MHEKFLRAVLDGDMNYKSNRREFMTRMHTAGTILAGGLAFPSVIPAPAASLRSRSSRITECLAIKTKTATGNVVVTVNGIASNGAYFTVTSTAVTLVY